MKKEESKEGLKTEDAITTGKDSYSQKDSQA